MVETNLRLTHCVWCMKKIEGRKVHINNNALHIECALHYVNYLKAIKGVKT